MTPIELMEHWSTIMDGRAYLETRRGANDTDAMIEVEEREARFNANFETYVKEIAKS